MQSRMGVMLFLLALLVAPAIGYSASPVEEGATGTAPGCGAASASPDSVLVDLYINEEPTYGAGGPDLAFVQPADLEDVRNLLVENGVDEESIEVHILSTGYVYGSNSPSEAIRFIYSDVGGLLEMTPGPIRSLSEDISSSGAAAPAGGCIAFASLESPGLYRFFGNAGSTATNSMNEVEIAISLKAAFALEPAR